jgi:Tfp pilus assembly protein PilF
MIDELSQEISQSLGINNSNDRVYDQRDPQVAEMYIRAINLWEKRVFKDSFFLAVSLLEEALELDPMDPDANALLALCYANGLERSHYPGGAIDSIKLLLQEHASNALKVNADETMALLAIGTLHFLNGKHNEARNSYQRAYNVAPHSGITSQAMGEHSLYLGDPVKALDYMRLARVADPHDHTIMRYLGWCEMANGFANASKRINQQMVREFEGEEHLNYYQWVEHMLNEEYEQAQSSYPDSLARYMQLLFDGLLYVETADSARYEQYLRDANDALSLYVSRYVSLMWNIHNGNPDEIKQGQNQYKDLYDNDAFRLNWFVQTYPLNCFESIRTDPVIVAYARSHDIIYKPHPYWKIQREVRE